MGNLALSLGMVGALSIIRFRTVIKDSRDMIYLFFAIAVGLGCGTYNWIVITITSVFLSLTMLVLHYVHFGKPMHFEDPRDAIEAGIATVHQHLAMIPLMSVARNFFMGNEPTKKVAGISFFDKDHADSVTMEEMRKMGINLRGPDQAVGTLSGGERRRVALCRLLLSKPDLLLLDEPTNHLDAESVHWLERHLAEYPGTVVAITHDRYFLDRNVDYLAVFEDGGMSTRYPMPYRNYQRMREEQAAQRKAAANASGKKPAAEKKPAAVQTGQRQLTWKEARELEDVEDRISLLEKEKAKPTSKDSCIPNMIEESTSRP